MRWLVEAPENWLRQGRNCLGVDAILKRKMFGDDVDFEDICIWFIGLGECVEREGDNHFCIKWIIDMKQKKRYQVAIYDNGQIHILREDYAP